MDLLKCLLSQSFLQHWGVFVIMAQAIEDWALSKCSANKNNSAIL